MPSTRPVAGSVPDFGVAVAELAAAIRSALPDVDAAPAPGAPPASPEVLRELAAYLEDDDSRAADFFE